MSNDACETPLLDLLNSVPADARMIYEHSPTHSSNIPVGVLAKRSAEALTAQAATIAEQARELEALRADAERTRDEAFEAVRKALNKLPRYSFLLNSGGVSRVPERYGAWIEWQAAHELFDPVAVDAALQASEPTEGDKCRKCGGRMGEGTYLAQTMTGAPDFPGDKHAVTVSPGGPGRLAPCSKCEACGWSVTSGKAVTP